VALSKTEKIRVLRIINRFNIGGPTYNATFLARFLPDEYETVLIGGLPEEGEVDSLHILEKYGVKPILIEELKREPSLKSDREAFIKIRQIIREFKPHIVHTHAAKAGALGRRAAFKEGVPIIIHTFHGHVFHSYFGKIKTAIFKTIERRLANFSSGIIAISEGQKHELSAIHNIAPAKKIEVIPLGFDLNEFRDKRLAYRDLVRNELGIKQDEVAVAIIGRLVPIKDHAFFFRSIELAQQGFMSPVKIFIVGDGTEGLKLEQMANSLPTKPNVSIEFVSWVKDVARFNAAIDLICLTSKNEGTPVSLIEAQAANIPVLSVNVGGINDIVVNGETGIVIDQREPELFAKKLIDLVNNNQLREKLSQNGWQYVGKKYHYTTLVDRMNKYYKQLLHDKGLLQK
jgi:glycosyltransferase involved in cell wall biosynthesis